MKQWTPPDAGVLRITNPKTLEKWKQEGRYQELINEGYIYAKGCGRFRKEICTCSKCRRLNMSFRKIVNDEKRSK